jgi:predicted sugar kinase
MQILNMATIRSLIIDALEKKYESDISKADATIKVYLENPVGIGEHPQIVDEVDKQISSICKAKEKLEELKNFKD